MLEEQAPTTPKANTQKIDELLRYAIQHNASDLHLTVGYPPIIRIDGELREVSDSIITPQEAEELILPLLSDEKKELLEVNKEIDFAHFYDSDYSGRFRINVYHTMKNLAAALRLIPSKIRSIDELMLPSIYHQFSQLKQGFILITGPTGHGKSTTLAAILEEINNSRFSHIITIEDPIEYVFDGKKSLIDQREMNEDTHSWPIALRSALRQDPDVILVGEMRDYETIASAITLAETGHLVFATLHTNSAAQTVDRIIDVFPENQQAQIRLQLSNILEAIVAQRLIPLDKGGRRAVTEIMIANPAIRNLIREAKTHQIDNVIRTSSDIGMVPLEKSLVALVREGVISVQKAQEYAVFPEEVLRLLKS
ncbi:type IV pili twitching motility protein PilT [candidate division WS6 bacterium RIFOXYC1_FULL_33_10]|uniref:Type IV pili twitching motility protein PilT n=2 Tax=Candidatus Dojkabacteria TaxID=74243 RepID=A0A1F4UFD2_9BACT|nr:MAG: type IV pili twitching motility protein PilT [candidate division WS6 bacterium RIFOXYB1_FULL_33_14]OGC47484.1 MAG: type IV pili twitching motility protein PilT [candidate division WS6 bacterium RIFOXYC1_FULL_33_10]